MSALPSFMDLIRHYLPLLLSIAALSTLLFAVLTTIMVLRIRESTENSAPQKGESETAPDENSVTPEKKARRTLQKQMSAIVKSIGLWRLRDVPWCLVLGDSREGGKTIFADAGAQKFEGSLLNWFQFHQGVTLVPSGNLGEIGKSHSRHNFTLLLKLMLRHKPRRPLDGLIITISARELISPESSETLGESVHAQLAHLQDTLGMRPPVYLLVTDCEFFEGFSEICNSLSPEQLHQMLGWSSPYVPDITWSSKWMQEAETSILGALEDLRSDIFSKTVPSRNAKHIFALSSCIKNIFTPLQHFANELFRHSVYHEPFLFRGIWFCGNPAGREKHGSVFIRDLISQKIFPEHACSVPVSRVMTRRTALARTIQAIATVILCSWAVLIWHGGNVLRQEVPTVLPVVRTYITMRNTAGISRWPEGVQIQQDRLEKMATRVPRIQKAFDNNARTLLLDMEKAKQEWITSVVFPTSFVTGLESRIDRSYQRAFNEIILKGTTLGLIYKGATIYEKPSAVQKGQVEPLTQMPAYRDLKQHIADSATFQLRCEQFNSLKKTHNVETLKDVINYVFDLDFQRTFIQEKRLEEIMSKSTYQPVNMSYYHKPAKRAFDSRMSQLYAQLFDDNPLLHAVNELVVALNDLTQNGGSYRPGNEEVRVEDDIEAVRVLLNNPEQNWPTKTNLPINWPMETLFAKAESETPLRAFNVSSWRKEGKDRHRTLYRKLTKKNSPITGTILVSDSSGLNLRPMVLLLQQSISDLQKQAFMHKAKDVHLSQKTPPATYLAWDIRLLEQAVDLASPFDTYFSNEMEEFPSSFRSTVKKQGEQHLADNIAALVAQAQKFIAVPSLEYLRLQQNDGSGATNFNQAGPLLLRILDIYNQLGKQNERSRLATVVDRQAMDLLRRSNEELTKSNLYSPRDQSLDKWNGKTPASTALFGLQSKNELVPYLSSQRDRLRLIINTWAEPALAYAYMRDNFTQNDYSLLSHWETILEDLDQYDSHVPGNPLSLLEQYILHGLDKPDSVVPVSGDSWFQKKAFVMYKAVHNRLNWLALQDFSNKWNQAADYFTRRLADHFPFSSPLKIGQNASPDKIRTFLSMLPEYTAGKLPSDIQIFLNSMNEMRSLVGETIQNATLNQPAFAVGVTFHEPRSGEINTEQLIDQKLQLGQTLLSWRNGQRTGLWSYGDPVSYTLQWAKDGARIPIEGKDESGSTASKNEVIYKYDSPWALLAFMQTNRFNDEFLVEGSFPEPGTMMFEVQTVLKESEKEGKGPVRMPVESKSSGQVRSFIRITLRKVGQTGKAPEEQITLPDEFPHEMPKFDPYSVWLNSKQY